MLKTILALAIIGSLIAVVVIVVWTSNMMIPDQNPSPPIIPQPPTNQTNAIDQFLDLGELSLAGVSPDTFNPIFTTLQFSISGEEFYQSLDEVRLTINDVSEPSGNLIMESHRISGDLELFDGLNNITFSAADAAGRPLYYSSAIWSGSNTLRIDVVDENGLPFTGPATVEARLSDDPSVIAQANTTTGTVELHNLPSRTIIVHASASDNRFGQVGVTGDQGSAQVRLLGFKPASTINNNDFNQGAAGWDIGTASVQINSHIEGFPPADIEETPVQFPLLTPPSIVGISYSQASIGSQLVQVTTNSVVDNDLTLFTSGQGEQSISRSFETSSGTTAVLVRYRFITSEVPGGYYGSEYNDYFHVSLRSQQGGGFAGESNTMNGLGLAAFDFASGATAWREVKLETNKEADTIQVDVGVANVADDQLDSQVVIDFVREFRDEVRPSLSWNNNQGGLDLSYSVEDDELDEDVTIDLYWANGPGYANRIGEPISSHVVPSGTAPGQYGPIHITGDLLDDNPAVVTHLIAASSPTSVGAVADVRLDFGPNANAAVVPATMIDILKDGLRAAGQSAATITSTARMPADQARAMFQNLVNPANTINVNVANQLGIYAPPGDAVINVFVAQTQGMNRQQIVQAGAAIQAAMVQEINNQGCPNVSRHCADPTQDSVVDVASAAFNANNGVLFVNEVQGRVTNFIDERNTNGCYHFELDVQ